MNLRIVKYEAEKSGKTLVVTGAIHGNEKCGTKAINRLIGDIEHKDIILDEGKIIFIPICNPRAYEENVRFIDRNLNRYLYPKDEVERKHYEDDLDPKICEVLEQADVLLDLHSYDSPGGPYIFLGPSNKEEQAYAKSLGIKHFVHGWADAFSKSNEQKTEKDKLESMGTTEYARSKGAIAVTLECGQHDNENNADIGYAAIVRALVHLGMTDPDQEFVKEVLETDLHPADELCVRMKTVIYKEKGAEFIKPWLHFDQLSNDEEIARLANDEIQKTSEDSIIILPHETTTDGTEWYYLGVKSDFP